MNIVFFVILISSIFLITKQNPQNVMGVMLTGISSSVELCLKLFGIYAIWLSILKILEKSRLDKGLAKLLKKPIGFLFSGESAEAYNYLSLNISANILGMGGAATPTGIKSMETMRLKKNKIMLVVLNATSIQLIPTTIVAMRATFGSVSDIILPSLIATIFTSVISIFLVKVFVK